MTVDLWSSDTKLARNRLGGHVAQQDLPNAVMDHTNTSGELRVSPTAKHQCNPIPAVV
jgi:hypothetical protein